MSVLVFGVNHKTAPVAVRERFAFNSEQLDQVLAAFKQRFENTEATLLSTCNRTELYLTSSEISNHDAVKNWLGEASGNHTDNLNDYLYQHSNQAAIRHLFRVACGLDSLVLGEPQILGQTKQAFQSAEKAGLIGPTLRGLFDHTFNTAKTVRTDTDIGSNPVSVAYAAVSLSKQIFGELNNSTAMVIGAGETIRIVSQHLSENRINNLLVANRTLEKAEALAEEHKGEAVTLGQIENHLHRADIVISSTGSPNTIVQAEQVKKAIKKRKHKPMLFVDIAVPRDIDSGVEAFDDAYLYTVDDLHEIIEENRRSREDSAKQAEKIIDLQVEKFSAWLRSQYANDTIKAYRQSAETLRDDVLEKAKAQLSAGKSAEECLQYVANTLTNKLIHAPSVGLRNAASQDNLQVIEVAETLFDLSKDKTS